MWNSTWVRGFSVWGRVQEIFKDMKRLSIFEHFLFDTWDLEGSNILNFWDLLLSTYRCSNYSKWEEIRALVVEKSLFGSCWPNPPPQIKEAIQKAFQKLHKSILISKLQKKNNLSCFFRTQKNISGPYLPPLKTSSFLPKLLCFNTMGPFPRKSLPKTRNLLVLDGLLRRSASCRDSFKRA